MIAPDQMAQMRCAAQQLQDTPAVVMRLVAGGPPGGLVVSSAGLTCHVAPAQQNYALAPNARLATEPGWTVRFPVGTDVLSGDMVLALGTAYSVLEVTEPRTTDLLVRTLCLRMGTQDNASDGTITPTYLQPNATVTIQRRGGTVPAGGANRRVRLDDPTPAQQPLPGGPQVASLLYDLPGADYRLADVVEITQVDGFTAGDVPTPAKYSVGEVDYVPAPWPLVRVQLTATSRAGGV